MSFTRVAYRNIGSLPAVTPLKKTSNVPSPNSWGAGRTSWVPKPHSLPPVTGWWWFLSRAGPMQVITIKDGLFLIWVTSSLEIFYYHPWNLPSFHTVHYLFIYVLTYFSVFQGIDDHLASVSEEADMLIANGAWETQLMGPFIPILFPCHLLSHLFFNLIWWDGQKGNHRSAFYFLSQTLLSWSLDHSPSKSNKLPSGSFLYLFLNSFLNETKEMTHRETKHNDLVQTTK